MINFMNDYNSPGHPAVLEAVCGAAGDKYPGYGTDDVCGLARNKILALLGTRYDAEGPGASNGSAGASNGSAGAGNGSAGAGNGSAGAGGYRPEVHFMVGGTQANLTAIGAFLRPHEAVIAPDSSHIQVHETGAIEAVGHRILMPPAGGADGKTGKIAAGEVRAICRAHDNEHMVKPRLVYISQSTELGGVYSLGELRGLREVCDEHGLLLYMDGARLGAALVSPGNDASLPDIAALCDAFYIGGTKNGLLFGEALVIMNPALAEDFRYHQKQRGGLLAKGFLLGLQFLAIMENGLYFELAAHAGRMAGKLRRGLRDAGCTFFVESDTNQIFPVLPTQAVEKLERSFLFERWQELGGGETAVRFVTSWNTAEEEADALIEAVKVHLRA